jgi:hypothetical protein
MVLSARRRNIASRKAANSASLISPTAHGEVGVPNAAEPANVAVDRHVVGRVGEHQLGLGVLKQPSICGRISRIRTEETVRSELPEVARASR